MHFARVHVHVIALVVDVVCLMLVLSVLVVLHVVFVLFRSHFSVVGGILFTPCSTSWGQNLWKKLLGLITKRDRSLRGSSVALFCRSSRRGRASSRCGVECPSDCQGSA